MSYRERVYKYSDKTEALRAVSLYGRALQEVSPALLNDRQIIMAAVKKNGVSCDLLFILLFFEVHGALI